MNVEYEKADLQMDVTPVLELLRNKIGLNPESIGTASVEVAVKERIELSGVASVEEYLAKVNWSTAEMKMLIESVVVRETSFFRNTTPFITLQSYLERFVLDKKKGEPLRILCLPCSTGEEAYSIAMVLFDMKLSAKDFFIFAGDISEKVLRTAKSGRYSAYSFRSDDVAFRAKNFSEQPDGTFQLKDEVRDAVRFEQINILSDGFLSGHKPYDVIFCRNLLIYFDEAAKEKAIKALSRHLSDEGVLFVGHAEGASILQSGFESLDYDMSFAFARPGYAAVINKVLGRRDPAAAKISPPIPAPVQKNVIKAGLAKIAKKFMPSTPAPVKNVEIETASKESLIKSEITRARQLADSGSYGQVVVICERLMADGVESAEIYFLLGQVAGSTGDNLLAEEYLKKAIYLNADFHDALIYLSLLFDRMGNPEKAASFRKRAQRVRLRNKGGEE